MDQLIRSNELGAEGALAPAGTKRSARGLGRAALFVGAAALIVLLWAGVSAHFASAKLKEVTEEQAVVTVATTKPSAQSGLSELILPGTSRRTTRRLSTRAPVVT
jgi:hypothetical protein